MQQFQSGAPVAVPHNVAPGTSAGASAAVRPIPMTASIRRPPSALRRLGTGTDAGYSGGNPVNINVQVEFRPVTQHGMTGMRTSGQQGPGRQLADTSFFAAELRNRITEIQEEIGQLEGEIDSRSREQSANAHLVRKYDEMVRTMEALEGQLADFNLAHDKIRSGTDIRDLTERVHRMEADIEQRKHGIDDLFSSRAALDAQRTKLEEEIAAILLKEEQCMAIAPPALLQHYTALKQESLELQSDLAKKEDLLVNLRRKAKDHEEILSRDEFRVHFRGLQLQKEKKELEERLQEIRDECDPNLTVEQMRERLQVKAKEDGIIIKTMEERLKAIEQETHQVQESLHERELQKENIREFEDINRKYEALYQRDKAMQEFIDKYESTRSKDGEHKRATQARIVALMEHISEGIIKKENLPSQKQVLAMESDLSFKSKELDASVTTLDRVRKELEKRKAELEQISGLGDKIRAELVNLRGRAAQMENEIVMLSDVEGMKEREAQAKISLQQELGMVKHKRAAIQVQVQNASKIYESKKKALSEDEDWKRLESLEAKLRTYSQTAFQLQSHVAARKRESDFELIRDQIINMTAQLNALIIDRQST